MPTRTLALALAAVLAPARLAHAVACFASDADDVYDKDGLSNGVVTVTDQSAALVPAAATPYDCTGVSFVIANGGRLMLGGDTATGAIAAVLFDSVTIAGGGVIEADEGGCPGGQSSPGSAPNASNVCIVGGTGSGTNGNDFGGSGGGGHGGVGGDGNAVGIGGGTYDSAVAPVRFGAGGGGPGGTVAVGGTGGGVIMLDFTGTLTNDGTIRADGGPGSGSGGRVTGGGAGGSIFVTAAQIEGSGLFRARGGNGVSAGNTSGAGAGGRIAILYGTGSFPFDSTRVDVLGGESDSLATDGDKGTGYVRNTTTNAVQIFHGFTFADVDHVASSWVSDASATNQYCDATISPTATPSVTATVLTFGGTLFCSTGIDSFELRATDTLTLSMGTLLSVRGALTLDADADFAMSPNVAIGNTDAGRDIVFDIPAGDDQVWSNVFIDGAPEGRFVIDDPIDLTLANGSIVQANVEWTNLGNLTLDASDIAADGKGCEGGSSGRAPDATNLCTVGATGSGTNGNDFGGSGGGGHGGRGGNGNGVGIGGDTYGSATAPARFGASGGFVGGTGGGSGGAGGGAVWLVVAGTLLQNGAISANGVSGAGGGGRVTGGGAGGSIFVTAGAIDGGGTFAAHGGDGINGSNDGGGGGGGRIALVTGGGSFVFDSADFDVLGGVGPDGAGDGDSGTVYVRDTTTNAVQIFHGFTFADEDHVATSWVSDPSATNQYCDATLGAGATPSVTATTVTFGGALDCAPAIESFTMTSTGGGTLAFTSAATFSANAAVTLAAGGQLAVGDGVTIRNTRRGADLLLGIPPGDDQVWTDVTIDGAPEGRFMIDADVDLTLAGTSSIQANALFTLANLTLPQGTSLDATGKGCATAKAAGLGAGGRGPDGTNTCMSGGSGGGDNGNDFGGSGGGGHGGLGGAGNGGAPGGGTYDLETQPVLFGASAGDTGGTTAVGGAGGGAIQFVLTGTLLHDGTIAADGSAGAGTGGRVTGGGAGGSIHVVTGSYDCTVGGLFSAAGGAGADGDNDGGGGGGGRIRVETVNAACASAPLGGLTAAGVAPGGNGPDGAAEGASGTLSIGGIGSTTTTSTTTSTSSSSTTSSTMATSSTTTTSVPLTTTTTDTTTTSTTLAFTTTTTTTTTLPTVGCAGGAATFASILCRLAALEARIAGASTLGTLGPKLAFNVQAAMTRVEDARARCAGSDARKARVRLAQARKRMTQFAHRLNGRAARRNVPDDLRQELLSAGQDVRNALRELRGAVVCPRDAG